MSEQRERDRAEALEAHLRDKYPDDALERLVRSNYDYYSTHGDYLPELARLVLFERERIAALLAENERLEEERDEAYATGHRIEAEEERLRTYIIYTPCPECGLHDNIAVTVTYTTPDPLRRAADCKQCEKARAALAGDAGIEEPDALALGIEESWDAGDTEATT